MEYPKFPSKLFSRFFNQPLLFSLSLEDIPKNQGPCFSVMMVVEPEFLAVDLYCRAAREPLCFVKATGVACNEETFLLHFSVCLFYQFGVEVSMGEDGVGIAEVVFSR